MIKRQIPFEQWQEFFNQFGRLHHDREAQITLIDRDGTRRPYASEKLIGLVDERHGHPEETISILLGDKPSGTASHNIINPVRVMASEWNDSYSVALEIESGDGNQLLVQVGPPEELLPPGMITDGILLEQRS